MAAVDLKKRAKQFSFQEIEVLESPTSLSGEDVLLGFILDLQPIFS